MRPTHCVICKLAISQPARGRRLYCAECRVEQQRADTTAWRASNPDRVLMNRAAKYERDRVRHGWKKRTDIKDRMLIRAAPIQELAGRGLSYSQIADNFGMTRNQVAGLLWRMKRSGTQDKPA